MQNGALRAAVEWSDRALLVLQAPKKHRSFMCVNMYGQSLAPRGFAFETRR